MDNFGNTLKILRKNKNNTQEDLAKFLSLKRSTIAGYETNRKQPDLETLIQIADYFDVSLDYLLGRTSTEININSYSSIINSDKEVLDFACKSIHSEKLRKCTSLLHKLSLSELNLILAVIKSITRNR